MYTVDGKKYYFTKDLLGMFPMSVGKFRKIRMELDIGEKKDYALFEFQDKDLEKLKRYLRKEVMRNE